MKNKALIILTIIFFQLTAEAQRRYVLDTQKSKVLWKLQTMGKHNGSIFFKSGYLNYGGDEKPKDGAFVIDMNTMHSVDGSPSGIKRVDGTLRNPDFFNVAKYPTSTILVKKILPTKSGQLFQVVAVLTIKGISQPISFTAKLRKQEKTVNASAELKIDRRKWRIAYKPKNEDFLSLWKDKLMQEDIAISLELLFKEQ